MSTEPGVVAALEFEVVRIRVQNNGCKCRVLRFITPLVLALHASKDAPLTHSFTLALSLCLLLSVSLGTAPSLMDSRWTPPPPPYTVQPKNRLEPRRVICVNARSISSWHDRYDNNVTQINKHHNTGNQAHLQSHNLTRTRTPVHRLIFPEPLHHILTPKLARSKADRPWLLTCCTARFNAQPPPQSSVPLVPPFFRHPS